MAYNLAAMADGELAIVIADRRPGGPQTLTPREPTREPNGTLWFGAELDPGGGQVWFRIGEEAIGRMAAETPAGRGRPPGRRPHRGDHAGRQLEPGINRFEVRVSEAGDTWIERLRW